MAAFAKGAYDAVAYGAFRPVYPRRLFDTIWAYHKLGRGDDAIGWQRALDLGCGTGQATIEIATQFEHTIGVDPSAKMIRQATDQLKTLDIPAGQRSNVLVGLGDRTVPTPSLVSYQQSSAEDLPFLEDASVDLVTAAQAAHWFDYPRLWRELSRVVRPEGTVAFWGYSEFRIRGYPGLTPLITYYSQGSNPIDPSRAAAEKPSPEPDSLSAYWEQPGRGILDAGLLPLSPPPSESFDPSASRTVLFSGEQRDDLFEATKESGRRVEKEEIILTKELTWQRLESYLRTWSSLANYLEKHPEEREKRRFDEGKGGTDGDIVDRFLARLRSKIQTPTGAIPENLEVEWPLSLLLFRRCS